MMDEEYTESIADVETTERLLNSPDPDELAAEILTALIAYHVGTVGDTNAALLLRSAADQVERLQPVGHA